MRKIGYSVKLAPEWASDFIKRYEPLFGAMEIKVKENVLPYLDVWRVNRLGMKFFNAFSLHIPKKAFYEKSDYELTRRLFKAKLGIGAPAVLVTHFMHDIPCNEEYLRELSEYAHEMRYEIALENVEMCGDLFAYLKNLKQLAKEHDFLVCLDVGHLFYSALKSNVSIQALLEFIDNDRWWWFNVVHFHMHDYNEERCHLNLGNGMMCWNDLCELLKRFDEKCPIIIETTVEDLSVQGIQEVQLLRERIGECENP